MDLLLTLEPTASRRAQLERQLRDGIRSGRLRPGAPLPPSRALARQLGVSRGIVVDAYSQLVAEGYLTARRGSGTRVAETIGAQSARPRAPVQREPAIRYDLRAGLPDVSNFPRRSWQSATARAMRELPDAWLLYGRPRGFSGLRVALTDYLARARATVADPGRILICTGISHGMTMVWRALRERGATRIAVEDPGWSGQAESVRYAGLEPVPVRVDERGLVVSELESAGVDAVIVTPTHQHPTGVVMAPERRAALVGWARSRDALIVEDDYAHNRAADSSGSARCGPARPIGSEVPASTAAAGTTHRAQRRAPQRPFVRTAVGHEAHVEPLNDPVGNGSSSEVVRKRCPVGRRAAADLIERSAERVAGLGERIRPVAATPEWLGRMACEIVQQEGGILMECPHATDVDSA